MPPVIEHLFWFALGVGISYAVIYFAVLAAIRKAQMPRVPKPEGYPGRVNPRKWHNAG